MSAQEELLTDEQRPVVNRAFQKWWSSPLTITIISMLFMGMCCVLIAGLAYLRWDLSRQNALMLSRTLDQLRSEISEMQAWDRQSVLEHKEMRRDMDAVKKAVGR